MITEQLEPQETFSRQSEMSVTKLNKIRSAIEFADNLGRANLKFIGISGSVSYEPREKDDIDIFIITEDGKLWQTLLRAFIVRRISSPVDICISLCMEKSFAEDYFRRVKNSLVIEDSLHVIPIFGSQFYEHLVSGIEVLNRNHVIRQERSPDKENRRTFSRVISLFSFIPLAVFLFLKGFIENSRLLKSGRKEEAFSTVISLDHFYFDSERYRKQRRNREVFLK